MTFHDAMAPAMPAADAREYLLQACDICKRFPGVVALNKVSLRVRAGEVHALMGENGAGKSTMMKILAGSYIPDEGTLTFRGKRLKLRSPREALDHGIAMIHQELNLLPDMTVAENIWIGREPVNAFGIVNHARLNQDTRDLLGRLNIAVDPECMLGELSIANRQMIEIAKAVSYESQVLIMDEPTSAITEKEVEHLFDIIASLKRAGKAIIYITHKMNEVFRIADDITILRDGCHILTEPAASMNANSLISAMVGREMDQVFPKGHAEIGAVALSLRGLSRKGWFNDVSFDVRYGEIVGLAGLMGAGRTEVMESLFGIDPPDSGQIFIDGKPERFRTPKQAIHAGLALLTEDRKKSGLFLGLDVASNMDITVLSDYTWCGFVQQKKLDAACHDMSRRLKIKTPNLQEIIGNLSGGNQQKALIARWLLNHPRILILDEPTRGVDVGAKAEIHKLVTELAQAGAAIILISSELPEVMGMSDRVIVMHEGQVSGEVMRADFSQEGILSLASGVVPAPPPAPTFQ
ncbi:sugar ABC transporter ATP-binding protein [Janthinobacterium psychrotolerans]|uniref:Inositol transport system ATP-binding protein n=1 Tax=Janthinobacterium psychrotolerans TaxID=1747903 RepID=A0A1A7C210_9BURK|nr:sugar ABC transporter ATP-binding protein [Janthinobacterium psychrotolerans]OBV39772.1 inositol transport system ATP-binding protein [Janthinobacterium psychrotolerans]